MGERVLRATDDRIEKFWAKVTIGRPDECWPWQGAGNHQGYGHSGALGKRFSAHRVALALVSEHLPDSTTFALHACDNPPCVNPHHLRWGTALDNSRDKTERGRNGRWNGARKADANPHAKLNWQMVREIRAAYPAVSNAELREKYGVAKSTIRNVVLGISWIEKND